MDRIPINFDHQGKNYSGYFNKVAGAGNTSVWYLMIDNYYYGSLRSTDHWVFDTNKKSAGMAKLADYFGDYLTAWYQ